jgi:hypothetical protein
MNPYALSHLADHVLLGRLDHLAARDRATTAELIAHIGEVDERRLHRAGAHPSMHAYCVAELHMSSDTAFRRIHVARAARRFPAIFPALADGRLNCTTVLLLAPHLTPENADELLAAAAHASKERVRDLVAARFPQPDVPTVAQFVGGPPPMAVRGEGPGAGPAAGHADPRAQLALEQVALPDARFGAEPVVPLRALEPARARCTPLSAERVALQVTVARGSYEKLQYARALLGHAVPSGDLAEVLDRALDALVARLEQQRFARGARLGAGRGGAAGGRHVPAGVRRAVWQRDGGRCTFVGEAGRRCECRTRLEFDHATAVARGGESTVANLRLRCRAHNQFAAERVFGAGFMRAKRERASRERAEREQAKRETAKRERATHGAASAAPAEPPADVVPWLRRLGFSLPEARRAAERGAHLADATLEARVKAALRELAPPHVRRPAPVPSAPA